MVEDYEVDLHVFTAKKKLLKSDKKHKTWIYFEDFVNAVHNCERRSQFSIVNVAATPRKIRQIFSERSGAVHAKNSGAVKPKIQNSEDLDFLVFFIKYPQIIAQEGPKRWHFTSDVLAQCLGTFLKNIKCNTRYVSKN